MGLHHLQHVVVHQPAETLVTEGEAEDHRCLHAVGIEGRKHVLSRGHGGARRGVERCEPRVPAEERSPVAYHFGREDVDVRVDDRGGERLRRVGDRWGWHL